MISTYEGGAVGEFKLSEKDKEDLKHHRTISLRIKGQAEELELLKQLSSKKISSLSLSYSESFSLDTSALEYLNFTTPVAVYWGTGIYGKTDSIFDKALMKRISPHDLSVHYNFESRHLTDLLIQMLPSYKKLTALWLSNFNSFAFPETHPQQGVLEAVLDALLVEKKLKSWRLGIEGLDSIPYRIGALKRLELLDLSHGAFESLPSSLGQLTKLTSLIIQRNSNLTQLPESIGNLRKLDQLYLSENQLKNLPSSIGKLKKLHTLYLYNNQLEEIGAFIGELTKLEDLRLSHNQLKTLPEEIKNLKNLIELHLSDNPISKAEQERIKSLLPNTTIYF